MAGRAPGPGDPEHGVIVEVTDQPGRFGDQIAVRPMERDGDIGARGPPAATSQPSGSPGMSHRSGA